jgi:PLP dependent protein
VRVPKTALTCPGYPCVSTPSASDHPIQHALQDIKRRIAAAATEAGRTSSDIILTAVSKTQPFERIAPVLQAGQGVFGENRVQEAKARWTPIKPLHPDLELRLIGPLQTNKAREAVGFFDVIETLDRDKLARALADAVQKEGKSPRFYVEVNTGEEPQKAGVLPADVERFLKRVDTVYGLPVEGLMCIPPADEPAFCHFALLRSIAARNGLAKLSMGMSGDFETAIRFGATSVRVGSAIFGARSPEPTTPEPTTPEPTTPEPPNPAPPRARCPRSPSGKA